MSIEYKQVIAHSMQSYIDKTETQLYQWRKLNAYDNSNKVIEANFQQIKLCNGNYEWRKCSAENCT